MISKDNNIPVEDVYEIQAVFKENRLGIKPNDIINGLVMLFPVKEKTKWAVKCFCGNTFLTNYSQVPRGITKSCGCLSHTRRDFVKTLKCLQAANKTDNTLLKIPTTLRTRDLGLSCNVCKVITYQGQYWEHLKQGRKFCRCSSVYKADYEEVQETCLNYCKNSTWGIESFPDEYTTKKNFRIPVKCSACKHKVNILYSNLVGGKGCQKCSDIRLKDRQSKDVSYFMEKAIERHGFRYDYSEVDYVTAKTHVIIKCREQGHKPFLQSPDNHYNKGKGCPECKKRKLKNVHFHTKRVEENKDLYKGISSGIYIMEVGDMIKIGISIRPEIRVKDVARVSGFTSNILFYKKLDLYNALYLEKSLHEQYEEHQQKDYNFEGHTECFYLNRKEIPVIEASIDSWEIKT